MNNDYINWKIDRRRDDSLWLLFDKQQEKVNSLDSVALDELDKILDIVKEDSTIKSLIITSAKKTGFIFGADVKKFRDFENISDAMQFIIKGHKVFDKLNSLKIITIARINGMCLGGGLELALACKYRIALAEDKSTIGLPEVLLGIQPGWGGSYRLPKLIGGQVALPLMLQGKILPAKKAKRLGIVDEAVPIRHLDDAVEYYITKSPRRRSLPLFNRLSNVNIFRNLIGKVALKKLREKIVQEHYPAPFAIVNNWIKKGISSGAQQTEIDSISDLLSHATAKNLIKVFFLREKLRNDLVKESFKGKHVHVIGAGTMGGDIAAFCAACGLNVTLQDLEPAVIAKAQKRANNLFKKKLKDNYLISRANDRLVPDVKGNGIMKADLIIEAAVENLDIKQKIFCDLEKNAKSDAVLATNTSSISLEDISAKMQEPTRLVGIHFFNPVALMPLVEIIKSNNVEPKFLEIAASFVKFIGKIPLVVKSSPGFLVNRVLAPYMLEGILMYQEGVPADKIDMSVCKFGMPQGPLELADMVGLDICLYVGEILAKNFDVVVPEILKTKVANGELGRKTGKGFYLYKKNKIINNKSSEKNHDLSNLEDRLILRYINEAVNCLADKIVDNVEHLDAGMIFGTGFAPFRGGPINYINTIGKENILQKLEILEKKYGRAFAVNKGWELF